MAINTTALDELPNTLWAILPTIIFVVVFGGIVRLITNIRIS